MFRRIFRTITNVFRRQKKDDDKDSEIEEFSVVREQEPENIPDFQVFPIHTAVSSIVNASIKPSEEPIDNEDNKTNDVDKVDEFGLQEIQFIPEQEPETIPDEKEKSKNLESEKENSEEAVSEKKETEQTTNSEEESTESESSYSSVNDIEETPLDSQKICREKNSKVTVYIVTIFLQPVSSSNEATPVRSQGPDKEKLENEEDSEKEKIEKLEDEKEYSSEAVSDKEKITEGNREEEEAIESSDSFANVVQANERRSIRETQYEIPLDSLKICESKTENVDVDSGLQCPLDSAIVETPLVPDKAKEEISVQQSSWTSIEDYDLKSLIGKGGFGKVYRAKHKQSTETVAIKALKKEGIFSAWDANRIHLEKDILELATRKQNPFVVGLFASFQTEHHLCLVMDYCAGGDLLDYLERPFPLEKTAFYAGCIVLGLQFLHKHNIIHRDIKPENILIASDGYLKITDFGISKKTKIYGGVAWTICGTRYYMAPELIECDRHTKSVDWWALGILIYEMLLSVPPFTGPNAIIHERIKRDEPTYPVMLNDKAINIIEGLLIKDPKKRLGASDRDAEEVMECSFFEQLDFDALSKKKITPPFIPKKKSRGCFSRMFPKSRRQLKLSKSQYKQTPKLVEQEFQDFDCSML